KGFHGPVELVVDEEGTPSRIKLKDDPRELAGIFVILGKENSFHSRPNLFPTCRHRFAPTLTLFKKLDLPPSDEIKAPCLPVDRLDLARSVVVFITSVA